MRQVGARLGAAVRRAGAIATRGPRAAAWTALALACALGVAAGAVLAGLAIDRWAAAHPGTGASMVVYLEPRPEPRSGDGDGADDARAAALVRELSALRGVERAELVPAAESARRLTRALGADPALLDGIDLASLPASVEVRLAPGVRDVVAISPTVRALRGAPGVADVVVEDGGGDPLAPALAAARGVAWPAAAVIAALALVIALAVIRIGLARPAPEARVLALLGASPGFTALPSVLAGALHGACAALVAAVALGAALRGLGSSLAGVASVAPIVALGALLGLGAVVGGLGGGLAGVARAR
jgi:cell division protein FtsX